MEPFRPTDQVVERLAAALAGTYVLQRELHGGGMSRVFEAVESALGRSVVVKLLAPSIAAEINASRFQQEIRLAANLRHPHIVPVLSTGSADGMLYYTMPYIRGESLATRLGHSPPLGVAEALNIAAEVADALDYAHRHDVVHRDIKPGNVLLEGDHAVVTDFGIARAVARDETVPATVLTQAGFVLGTPHYMSPEQGSGDAVDGRSDIYALACVLYEMLAGAPPFAGSTMQSLLVQHLVHPPPPITRPHVPVGLHEVVRTALAKSPGARFPTAAAFRDALLAVDLRDVPAEEASRRTPPRMPISTATRTTSPSGPIDSVAVLPFASSAADSDDEYLADGITESILNRLTRISGLRVVPRSTVFSYKRRDVDALAVGRELRVRALVTGRVVQRGDQLMVSAELTDSASESQLWGDRLVRRSTDIFAVQEEVATEIVKSLRLRLSAEESRELVRRQTEDSEAYHAYLRGRHQWNKRTREGFQLALRHFQEAIDHDPAYALAYTGLADTYNVLGYYNFAPPREVYPRATAAAQKALELDPGLAAAHASLGYTRLFFDWDWEGARSSFEQAIALDPGYASAHQWYAWYLLVTGRLEEMIAAMRTALQLDPLSPIINAHMGYALFWAGRHDEALAQLQNALSLDADFALTYWPLGAVHVWKGNGEEAIRAFRSLVELTKGAQGLGYLGMTAGKFGRTDLARSALARLEEAARERYVSPLDLSICHAGVGDYEAAFEWLDRAFDDRVSDVVRLTVLPWPVDMRNDARFVAALARLRLTP
ncbi:MAG TPA: protein kinase [Gemmatimonadales bacterium]|nr:protein kinase [Gemmatimonadales bacterium]